MCKVHKNIWAKNIKKNNLPGVVIEIPELNAWNKEDAMVLVKFKLMLVKKIVGIMSV